MNINLIYFFIKCLTVAFFCVSTLHSLLSKWILDKTVGILKFSIDAMEMVKILLKIKK